MAVRKRRSVANYLNVGKTEEEYALMGVGFTELNESPSAQSSSKMYITDKSATKSITSYEWESGFDTDQVREESAVEHICNIGEMQLTGDDAETNYIIVDLDKKGSTENTFRARKFKVAIEVSDFEGKDGEMSAKGKLLGVGDLVVGTFDTSTKKFTPGFPTANVKVGQ